MHCFSNFLEHGLLCSLTFTILHLLTLLFSTASHDTSCLSGGENNQANSSKQSLLAQFPSVSLEVRQKGESMDTQTPNEISQPEFPPGTPVIYAMHGKCQILGTETRSLDGQSIRFYKLEITKSTYSRSSRQDPAIWVPVLTAKGLGLREPMTKGEAEGAMGVLFTREYYFRPNDSWTSLLPQLEASIRSEGGIGLAKVASFLYVLKRKQIVPTPEVLKLQEAIHKLLFKELSEALGEPSRDLELKVAKGLKSKLLPDA